MEDRTSKGFRVVLRAEGLSFLKELLGCSDFYDRRNRVRAVFICK